MQSVRWFGLLQRHAVRKSLTVWGGRCMCTKEDETSVARPRIQFMEQPQLGGSQKPHVLHIDWDIEMQQILEDEQHYKNRSILAPVDDETEIYAEPMLRPSYTLAAYVQKSETLQHLIRLGVDLNRIDRARLGQFYANLDFKRDVEPYILMLTQNIGIPIEVVGDYITRNPAFLKESLDDIQVRVNYLALKKFSRDDIISILSRNPKWLSYSTREIDDRLGFFQKEFQLTGNQVRSLTLNSPKIITDDLRHIKESTFSIREECGFEDEELKQVLLKCPKIWRLHRLDLLQRYDYVSHHMQIDNSQIAATPRILENRLFKIKERHGFLKKIGRAQYNPKLELYVPLDIMCLGTDEEFAVNVAKRPYEEFDQYLRTL